MANGRTKARKGDSGRVPGGFVALPWSVLDCPAYARLSHPARSLLLELARQFCRNNNGRLLTSLAYLSKRGWNSADVIGRAKKELIEAGFIHETVKGHRPNKASWHALTWQTLDRLDGYDPGAVEGFRRAAYLDEVPLKNATLRPSAGVAVPSIAPSHGAGSAVTAPSHGAIKPTFTRLSTPSHGKPLDTPSVTAIHASKAGEVVASV